ncbi:uncharacterized protein VTP21DRAFT_8727 [Calcarisporiella thermophila]|uniref:uncharacterized protein n=1 Tax=Calcarisporiella thermophila TaxID=911321 RepID=UPI003742C7F0
MLRIDLFFFFLCLFIIYASAGAPPHSNKGAKLPVNCKSFYVDFTKARGTDVLTEENDARYSYTKEGLVLHLTPPKKYAPAKNEEGPYNKFVGGGPTFKSKFMLQYGSVEITLKTAEPGGAVTAFILMAPNGDEIDYEWVGGRPLEAQTNFFSKGVPLYNVNSGKHRVEGIPVHDGFHRYKIVRTPQYIAWYIDEKLIRVTTREETCKKKKSGVEKRGKDECSFPEQPAFLQFGLWDGSDSPGTAEWANGPIRWDKAGGIQAVVKDVSLTCYA